MSKSALVKIGVPSEQANGMRRLRRFRQILAQHDAAVARLEAATHERMREALNGDADLEPVGAPDATDQPSASAH